jgi:hypothetical protein
MPDQAMAATACAIDPISLTHDKKSLFASFSSEKEQESSFSEEKEAKRLLLSRCVT